MQIAVLMSVQPVMRMLSPTLWGWLADHTGQRLLVVQLAALCSVLSYLGVFFTTEFVGLLLVSAELPTIFWMLGVLSFISVALMALLLPRAPKILPTPTYTS